MSFLSADTAEADAPPSVGPTPIDAPRRWELLGQLEKTAIGARAGYPSITIPAGYQAGNFDFIGSNFSAVMPYVVMVLILLVRPYGLFGTREVRRV